MASRSSTKHVVRAALIGNLLVAVTKGVAAAITGSSAMLSEAIHSCVDSGNEVLLLYGLRRAVRRPDTNHPLGHGRELYFWSFIVALLVFALGAAVSIYQGIERVRHPHPINHAGINYIVLALAFMFEGWTWLIALRQFKATKGGLGFYEAFRRSKDPPSFIVLFEDSAALLGILIAALATYGSEALHAPVLDGVGSMLIGLVLAGTAMLLARESKSLLIGEQADPALTQEILRIVSEDVALRVNGLLTVQLAPEQVIAALSLEFDDSLTASDIEQQVIEIERRVRSAHTEVVALFIKPQTPGSFKESLVERFGSDGGAV